MIEQKVFLEIAKTIISSLISQDPISLQQQIVQKFSEILSPTRCLVFKIFLKDSETWCKITAGVPAEEHGIGLEESLAEHPDVEEAVKRQETFIIENPRENSLTAYFHSTIEAKNINQILYIPIKYESRLLQKKAIKGVIVVDAVNEKKEFTAEEIDFCSGIGELISMIIDHEGALIQQMRDLIVNRITSLGGFALGLKEFAQNCLQGQKCSEYAKIISEEIKMLEKLFPQGWRISF